MTPRIHRPGHRRARPLTAAAGLAVLTIAAAACSSASTGSAAASGGAQSAAADVSQVTLHIGDQAGTGAQSLLTAAGLIHKLPFKVTWSDFTSGPPMLQAMASGAVDVGGVGNSPPIFALAGGDKITIVGAQQSSPQQSALLVPKNSPIHSISQLRGKRIAVAQGSSADYHLFTVLKKAGLTVHDATLQYLQPPEALAALSSGHTDAWDIWSPYAEEAEARDGARVLADGAGFGSPYGFEVASQAALASPAKAAAVRDYMRLLYQARAWANSHPAAWGHVWAQATGEPLAVMQSAARDSKSTPVAITPAVITSEQQVADAFTASGLIPGHVDIAQHVDTRYNSILGSGS
jgi:sulfonate transport system substrate-binding protein